MGEAQRSAGLREVGIGGLLGRQGGSRGEGTERARGTLGQVGREA